VVDIVEIIIPLGIVAFIFFIFNTIMAAILFFTQRRVGAISTWPSTSGTILYSRVEEHASSEGGTIDHPVVKYSYRVNGREYQSERIAPGPALSGTGAGRVVARYPAGIQVNVSYNPGNPSDAVLERKASVLWVWILVLVVNCILCSVVPIIFWAYPPS
jgi:hypothetical protein